MHPRIYVCTFLLLFCMQTSAAWAQGEQWLQYRSASEAREIVGDMGSLFREPSSVKPADIKLPNFKAEQPMFLDWRTPMAASGTVWLALDRSSPSGQYDRLYIDANANGDLSDDIACQPSRQESNRFFFGPLRVVFDTADGPITYHLIAELRAGSARRVSCLLSSACWYEGPITVDGEKRHCVLIDYTVNGVFNDKAANAGHCDRIRIGPPASGGVGDPGGRDTRYVGNFIEVGDKLHRVEIARDGAFIILTEAADVIYGTARVAGNISSLGAGGVNGLFFRTPERGVIKLPVGDYCLEHWSIVRNDDKGARWELRADPGGNLGAFAVVQDQEKELPFGEPIYSTAEYSQSGSFYNFSQSLEGRHGERITLTRNGSQPPPPKLRIRDRDGAYDRALSFEYG